MPVPTSEIELETSVAPRFPLLTRLHIINCSFSSWYEGFRAVTLKSAVIPLPKEFVNYLHADGIFLPGSIAHLAQTSAFGEDNDDNDSNGTTNWDEDDVGEQEETPSFPDLELQISNKIREFDGSVFPKLNWSSPRDAAWITTTQTLRCCSPSDILLLLKSSDFIVHDLDHPFENAVSSDGSPLEPAETSWQTYELVLRKWYDLQPSMEFRCFVHEDELVAMCQRDMNYYEFLEGMREEIKAKINNFFETYIRDRFPDANYVFDVYIPRHRHKVWLIDFNPFSPATDSLLFEWSEILQANSDQVLRLIASPQEANARTSSGPRFASNMYPCEVIQMSDRETIAEFAERFSREVGLAGLQGVECENESEEE